jgi:FAD/FMN-containing dehydrogenase
MALPSGEKVTASQDQNQERFWTARGAGSGFFDVATKFHLILYPLPKAITASVYFYPCENVVEVADWLGAVVRDRSGSGPGEPEGYRCEPARKA